MRPLRLFVALLTLLLPACGPDPTANAAQAQATPATCPITRPPDPLFVPPAPYPAQALAHEFWHGAADLWTMLPLDGTWHDLPLNPTGYTQKIFWWHAGYDASVEPQPALTVTGRRLDANAPPLIASSATNASHPDFNTGMLVGVEFPTLGCWEVTGEYGGQRISFVILVTP